KIDRNEARRIAALAHLEFDEAGLDRMAGEMTKILGYIESLPNPESRIPNLESRTPLRDDVVRPSVDLDAVARNAPEWEDGFFVVPPVIE
ncbi:MAG TPA: Asp-tRNA(Asn)/Glu-tRNA(Gln) amidotransferase subunit GatC, partial [Thermoanaerobaculia bacterium]|nr:Asp-tRNA(Asn)/Glu-tRNA(Gln) amidotransferase subunit GatC [Thermoanaerobaculia bacterium]